MKTCLLILRQANEPSKKNRKKSQDCRNKLKTLKAGDGAEEKLDDQRDRILREANEKANAILREAKEIADKTMRKFP